MAIHTEVIDGKAIGQSILAEVKQQLDEIKITPILLIIQIGELLASTQYVALKKKRAEEIGIHVLVEHVLEIAHADMFTHLSHIIDANKSLVDGIMIQLPLPEGTNTKEMLSLIPTELDVDGLRLDQSPWNTAVADGVLFLLKTQKNVSRTSKLLILGEAPYVGASIITALKKEDYEYITSVNEFTPHKEQHMRQAEVVISCIGRPHIYSSEQLHKGTALIDVGTSKNSEGILVGDFELTKADGHLSSYTPVPGGVGPMTVAFLLKHVSENAIKRRSVV